MVLKMTWLDLMGELYRLKLAGTLWYIENRLRFAETNPLLVTEHCWLKGWTAIAEEQDWRAKVHADMVAAGLSE